MKENELVGIYARLRKEGKPPFAAEFVPADRRLEWIMEDESREQVDLSSDDDAASVESALKHLRKYCEAKFGGHFKYWISN